MKNNKSLLIAAIVTILFGLISKWLVGIPYIMWEYFDLYSILSFVLWVLYPASLYVVGKTESRNNVGLIKTGCCGFIFGMIASCIKAGIDALILLIAGETDNQIVFISAMEIGIILFGIVMMIFLYSVLLKRNFMWNKSLNKYAGILAGTAGIYAAASFYFYSKYQTLTSYTDIDSLTENENINLHTMLEMERTIQYTQTFTMLSMLVYVIFFIVFWTILQKGTEKKLLSPLNNIE